MNNESKMWVPKGFLVLGLSLLQRSMALREFPRDCLHTPDKSVFFEARVQGHCREIADTTSQDQIILVAMIDFGPGYKEWTILIFEERERERERKGQES